MPDLEGLSSPRRSAARLIPIQAALLFAAVTAGAATACAGKPPAFPFVQRYTASAGDRFYFEPGGRLVLLDRRGALAMAKGPVGYQAYAFATEITLSEPAEAQLGDPPGGMLMNRKLTGTAVPMERLVFSPFGVRLAGGASNGNVTVWDFGLGHPVSMAQPAGVTSLAFSPGGEILAVGLGAPAGEEPATVRLLDYPEGGLRAQFGTSAATALLYAPDQTLYAGFEDGSWARRSTMGEVTPSGDRARAAVTSLALHPAGAVLAIARRDKQVELREIATGKTLMTLTSEVPANPLFPRGVEQVEFNAAGTQVAAAFADGEILIWDCAALNPKDKPPPPVSF